jgi:amino acid permease
MASQRFQDLRVCFSGKCTRLTESTESLISAHVVLIILYQYSGTEMIALTAGESANP